MALNSSIFTSSSLPTTTALFFNGMSGMWAKITSVAILVIILVALLAAGFLSKKTTTAFFNHRRLVFPSESLSAMDDIRAIEKQNERMIEVVDSPPLTMMCRRRGGAITIPPPMKFGDVVDSIKRVEMEFKDRSGPYSVFAPPSGDCIGGGNNCLFDAVIASTSLRCPLSGRVANSQRLRDLCDCILEREGLPTIQKGEPAGEQYLQALSYATRRPLSVYIYKKGKIADVAHETVATTTADDPVDPIPIIHMGSQLNGHWVGGTIVAR
jgi:hypothetical protein